ncbi:nucleoside triphosphate pyrophosphohydrolase [Alkalibacillus almallahensis]|uniref:nucleoside triphosphate pyrophosphohydrolase n=1 Tax=Alkalibacillus almallahensis TaxID=1379154 RepID=UPI00141E8A48|nr:nucleoside triphosphate pyrophosphohydrolase [Alkalibacillus almallahensis]NIK11385.1 putative house-cleaning noncanonical NTP pyrophosphatase (MazG superfamily) [Alkalibacillus almallahensis]
MPVYQKLVRDYIPEIIENTGKAYSTRILNTEEYTDSLKKKLYEEVNEIHEAENTNEVLEELADALELIHALAKVHDADISDVEAIRQKKASERGGFDEKIFLEEVED